MALHLLKLCVGAVSVADLQHWIEQRVASARRLGHPLERVHTTRMMPKRRDELLANGSLYWVIKGQIAARQKLIDIRPFTDSDGIGRCDLVMEPVLHLVRMRPCRPFQGWRYLSDADASPDIGGSDQSALQLPEQLRRELAELGLM